MPQIVRANYTLAVDRVRHSIEDKCGTVHTLGAELGTNKAQTGQMANLCFIFQSLLVAAGDASNQAPAPGWRGVLEDDAAQHIAQTRAKLDAGINTKKQRATRTECASLTLFNTQGVDHGQAEREGCSQIGGVGIAEYRPVCIVAWQGPVGV
jgi:hypothetical protein